MVAGRYGLHGHYAISHVKVEYNLGYVIALAQYPSMVVFFVMEVIKILFSVIQQSAKVFVTFFSFCPLLDESHFQY